MGQSQLLMIVLAVIIIGIAVTVGITQFGESALTGNRDALGTDCQTIISKAQSWYRKPTSLGGGGNAFTGVTLAKLGVGATNENGTSALTVVSASQVRCVGTGNEKTAAGASIAVTMNYYATGDSTTYSDNM